MGMEQMTVSELAREVDTSADTIRYYERIGLLPDVDRNHSGYRVFGEADLERVRFVKRAQRFGLRLDEIRELLDVRDRGLCPCGHAHSLLERRSAEIEGQLAELQRLLGDIQGILATGRSADAAGWPCGSRLVRLENRRTIR
jgi:DNA-binding transcriptional MerR regulator